MSSTRWWGRGGRGGAATPPIPAAPRAPPARLSHRYIADRFLPDKAVDLIDEAASKIRIEAQSSPDHVKVLEQKLQGLQNEEEALAQRGGYEQAARVRTARLTLRQGTKRGG